MREFSVTTQKRSQLVDITELVRSTLGELDGAGAALVYVPHTTAGVTINEHADPAVARDFEVALERIVSEDWPWQHIEEGEENAPTHIRAAFMGPSVLVPVRDGNARARHLAGDLLLRVRRPPRAPRLRDDAVVIEVDGPQQAVRQDPGGRRAQLPRRAGHDHRLPRAERRRQVDDAALGARARAPGRGQRDRARRPLPPARPAAAPRRRRARGERGASGPLRAQPPARAGGRGRPARVAGRGGARARRADRRREAAREGLLARDAPAPRARDGAARRPGGARARRAGERARSRRDQVAAGPPPLARRRGSHDPRLEPRALRGRADRRPRRDHPPRPADPAGGDRRRARRRPGRDEGADARRAAPARAAPAAGRHGLRSRGRRAARERAARSASASSRPRTGSSCTSSASSARRSRRSSSS